MKEEKRFEWTVELSKTTTDWKTSQDTVESLGDHTIQTSDLEAAKREAMNLARETEMSSYIDKSHWVVLSQSAWRRFRVTHYHFGHQDTIYYRVSIIPNGFTIGSQMDYVVSTADVVVDTLIFSYTIEKRPSNNDYRVFVHVTVDGNAVDAWEELTQRISTAKKEVNNIIQSEVSKHNFCP